jgi:hypothetical protein
MIPYKNLNCCFNGSLAYIYIWFSKKQKMVYVGQTNNRKGTIGRAIEHVSESGTLRKQFEEKYGQKLEDVDDLYLLSFPLPSKYEFICIESAYRLAVEYNVQIALRELRNSVNPIFNIISRVTYTDIASEKVTKDLATKIATDFLATYSLA